MIRYQLCLKPFFFWEELQFVSGKTTRGLEFVGKDFQYAIALIREVVTTFSSDSYLELGHISIESNRVYREKIMTVDNFESNENQISSYIKKVAWGGID